MMKKIALLSLSIILVTSYSLNPALPSMLEYYASYSTTQVESLVSISSAAIMIVVILSSMIRRLINERKMIVTGLLLYTVCGILPFFVQSYPIVLFTRFFFGVGLGLVNTEAISMISKYYSGQEASTLLGFRGAAEMLGNAILTLIAGRLLLYGWNSAVLIYLTGIPVILLFLLFVPKVAPKSPSIQESTSITASSPFSVIKRSLVYGLMGFLFISADTCIMMRIPVYLLEKGFTAEENTGILLSAIMIVSVIGGVMFGQLTNLLREKTFAIGLLVSALGIAIMIAAPYYPIFIIGGLIMGYAHTGIMTCLFDGEAQSFTREEIDLATAITLVGCNLGASSAPLVMKGVSLIHSGTIAPFYLLVIIFSGLGIRALFHKILS